MALEEVLLTANWEFPLASNSTCPPRHQPAEHKNRINKTFSTTPCTTTIVAEAKRERTWRSFRVPLAFQVDSAEEDKTHNYGRRRRLGRPPRRPSNSRPRPRPRPRGSLDGFGAGRERTSLWEGDEERQQGPRRSGEGPEGGHYSGEAGSPSTSSALESSGESIKKLPLTGRPEGTMHA